MIGELKDSGLPVLHERKEELKKIFAGRLNLLTRLNFTEPRVTDIEAQSRQTDLPATPKKRTLEEMRSSGSM